MRKKITFFTIACMLLIFGLNSVKADIGEVFQEEPVAGSNVGAGSIHGDAPSALPGTTTSGSNTLPGTTTSGGSQSSGFGNPISSTTVEGVLGSVMGYLKGIAGTIAVIFIIIGGVMYMVSGGNKEATERAKKTVIFALVGLAIVIAAPLFYQEIKAILDGGSPGSALQQVLLNVLRLLLAIAGFLAIISMVIGGIWMFSAVGDEERYKLGQKTATYSIIGLVIVLASLILAQEVIKLVGGNSAGSGNLRDVPVPGSTNSATPNLPSSGSTTKDPGAASGSGNSGSWSDPIIDPSTPTSQDAPGTNRPLYMPANPVPGVEY